MKNMNKKILHSIYIFAGLIFAFFTVSCNFGAKDESKEAYISFDVSSARTIMPEFDTSNFSNFILTGTYEAEEPVILGSWNDLSTVSLKIKAGIWNFALTAKNGSACLEGVLVNKVISAGENVLSFDMEVVSYGNASSYGSVSVTLTVPDTVKAVKAGLFNVETEKAIADFEMQTVEVSNHSATYKKTIVPTGSYLVKFFMYSDEAATVLLNEYSEVVVVASEAVSKGTTDIENVNTAYTIEYDFGKGALKEGVSCKTTYSILTTISLPTADDMYYEDHVFAGWYEEADFSGIKVLSIPAGTTYGNKKYYARWVTQGNFTLDVNAIATKIKEVEANGEYTFKASASSLTPEVVANLKTALSGRTDIIVNLDLSGTNGLETLSASAFANCTSLQSIILPSSITTMGSGVFAGCSNLTHITIPFIGTSSTAATASATSLFGYIFGTTKYTGGTAVSQYYSSSNSAAYYIPSSLRTVTVLGGNLLYGAFYNCSMLTEIELSASLTSLGDCGFCNCSGLTGFTIPAGVTTLGSSLFKNCSSITEITIPAAVTTIGSSTFYGLAGLNSVTFEDNSSLKTIDSYAFQNCTGISRIDLSSTKVETIGSSCFSGCTNLISINMDSGSLTTIKSSAFQNCSSLTSVEVPSTVTAISAAAFGGCAGLTSMKLPFIGYYATDDSYRSSFTLFGYIFGTTSYTGGTKISQTYYTSSSSSSYANSYYIPSGLTTVTITGAPSDKKTVQQYAFNGCTVVPNIILEGGVLENYAFASYTGLKTFEYKNPSTVLPTYFFNGDTGLTTVKFTNPTSDFNKISSYDFYGCTSLSSLEIPSTIKTIDNYAFYNCKAFANVTLPSGLTTINSYAFQNCSSISKIVIPTSVTAIGSSAFYGCTGLTEMTIPFTGSSAAATTPSSSTVFGYIFGSSSYTGTVAGTASYYCTSSTASPSSATTYYYPANLSKVTYTGTSLLSGAFSGAKTLTSIDIPSEITEIPDCCFRGCEGLTVSPVKSTVTSIGRYALYDCKSLTSITIPSGVTELKSYVFALCSALPSITIPENITSVGTCAFNQCSSLEALVIPDVVTSIGSQAIAACTSLKELTIPFIGGSKKDAASSSTTFGYIFGTYSLTGTTSTAQNYKASTTAGTFYIPDSLKKVTVTGGNRFYGAFQNCKNLEEIVLTDGVNYGTEDYAFSGCTSLKSVRLPENTKMLGNYAFYNCSALTEIINTESLSQFGDYAFSGCAALVNFTIPAGIKTLNSYLFNGCTSLAGITITPAVTSIKTYAFAGCAGITTITIPETVTSIGSAAFSGCSGLTEMSISFVGSTPDATTASSSTLFGYIFGSTSYTGGTAASQQFASGGTTYSYYIPTSLAKVHVTGKDSNILYGAFSNCSKISMLDINDEIYNIGTNAFLNVSSVHYHGTAAGSPWGAKEINRTTVVEVNPSTCITHGTGNKVCEGCGKVVEENVELPLGDHSVDQETLTCTLCGAEITSSSWKNTSNSTYKFTQSGTTWTSNNKGVTSSAAISTWTIMVYKESQYSFNYSVSSESSYDKLTIEVDTTVVVSAISGTSSGTKTVTLTPGSHTITATYSKDTSKDVGSDCGTITLNDLIY